MRAMTFLSLSLALHACAFFAYAKSSKRLQLQEGEVAQINTSIGYSTILQFDAHPEFCSAGRSGCLQSGIRRKLDND